MGSISNALTVIPGGALAQPYDGGRLPAVQQLGAMLAKSGYFADAREAAQAAVKVMAGEELGLAPVASMMGINIIKGKVALSANLMAAQVRRHGYNYRVKSMTNQGCVIEFVGRDGKLIGESSFDQNDAKQAGINSEMYNKYPRNMYFSRAMSNGVKWFCPEVTSGLPIYTPEEMGAAVNAEGEVIPGVEQIDTGGHPVGTQAAADAVAERKLAEMQQRQKPAQQTGGKSPDYYKMLEAFKGIKPQIGEEAYYRILGNAGFEKSSFIPDVSTGRRIYAEMMACLKAQTTARERETTQPQQQEPQPAAKLAEQLDALDAGIEEAWAEGRD